METIRLTSSNIQECATQAAEVMQNGGVIIFPTDTLYGLGVDAFSNAAVDKIFSIKGRDEGKPIHCVVRDMAAADEIGQMNTFAHLIGKQHFPGPLTLIVKKKAILETGIVRGIETIGIRVPDNLFCLELASHFGRPYTATSANKSGSAPERSIENILEQLGKSAAQVDLIVDAGELPESKPSTVVDVSGNEPFILREGAIDAAEIWDAVKQDY